MVYANKIIGLLTKIIVVASSLTIIACGSGTLPEKEVAAKLVNQSELLPTMQFIPKQKTDKKGQIITYEPKANPYLANTSKLKKESIDTFIQARNAFKQNNIKQAEKLLEQLIQADAKLSGPWVMLGNIALANGELKAAQNHFIKAIATNKYNVNAYLPLAKVQRMQGAFTDAQNTYAEALQLWKDFPEAHLNLGVLYDVYINDNIKAQKHMEAYQFLTGGKNKTVSAWIIEIQKRTGMATSLIIKPNNSNTPIIKPVS